MEFFDWSMLGTFAGVTAAVGVFTQITKNIPGINKLPTQVWSYIIALVTLTLALVFGPGFTAEGFVLAVFNAGAVSLASNGGYEGMQRMKGTDGSDG